MKTSKFVLLGNVRLLPGCSLQGGDFEDWVFLFEKPLWFKVSVHPIWIGIFTLIFYIFQDALEVPRSPIAESYVFLEPTCKTIGPFSCYYVKAASWELKFALSVHAIIAPLSLVFASILPYHSAGPISLIIFKIARIFTSILVYLYALAVSSTIDPGSNVAAVFPSLIYPNAIGQIVFKFAIIQITIRELILAISMLFANNPVSIIYVAKCIFLYTVAMLHKFAFFINGFSLIYFTVAHVAGFYLTAISFLHYSMFICLANFGQVVLFFVCVVVFRQYLILFLHFWLYIFRE